MSEQPNFDYYSDDLPPNGQIDDPDIEAVNSIVHDPFLGNDVEWRLNTPTLTDPERKARARRLFDIDQAVDKHDATYPEATVGVAYLEELIAQTTTLALTYRESPDRPSDLDKIIHAVSLNRRGMTSSQKRKLLTEMRQNAHAN